MNSESLQGTQHALVNHPDTPAGAVQSVSVSISRAQNVLTIDYVIGAAPAELVLPAPGSPERTDGLWQTTCLELFLRDESGGYAEFNFSPSGQWAAYRFSAYREGMEDLAMDAAPSIRREERSDHFALSVLLTLPKNILSFSQLGLTAVIEEKDGVKSYWALAHPAGRPDFHHEACFVGQLPAPDKA